MQNTNHMSVRIERADNSIIMRWQPRIRLWIRRTYSHTCSHIYNTSLPRSHSQFQKAGKLKY